MERGQIFAGKYQIVGPLGKGGMGTVHEAIHLASGQRVALKLITGVEINDEVLLRFIREAESAERINSPNVVRIYDLGSDLDTGIPYMVMEKLSGSDISHLLRGLGPLPPNTAAKIAAQACAGLAQAHDQGIVHRDIKPGNLFVATSENPDECVVKVLDFGIAKLTEDASQDKEELTQTGSVLGSPHYMSPEQAQGLKTIDARSDIWSLGVVLYKMLCGKAPHADYESLGQIILAICSKPAPPVQSLAPWIPPELSAIVDRCLQIDPNDRYASAREFEDALIRYLGPDRKLYTDDLRSVNDVDRMYVAPASLHSHEQDPGSFSTQNSLELSYHRLEQLKSVRKPWLIAGGGALAVALLGVGITLALRPPTNDTMPSADWEPPVNSSTASPAHEQVTPTTLFEVKDVGVSVVAPEGSQVFLDGRVVVVTDGTIEVSGSLGSEHEVRIVVGDKDVRESITIGESGAKPNRVIYTAPTPVNVPTNPSDGSGSSHTRPRNPGTVSGPLPVPVPSAKKPSGTLKPRNDFE